MQCLKIDEGSKKGVEISYLPITERKPVIKYEKRIYNPYRGEVCIEPTKVHTLNAYDRGRHSPLHISINEKENFMTNVRTMFSSSKSKYIIEDNESDSKVVLLPGAYLSAKLNNRERSFTIRCKIGDKNCFSYNRGEISLLLKVKK